MMRMGIAALVLAAGTTLGMAAQQTAGQDMKDAGHSTSNAAKSAGSGIKKGTVTGYEKTKSGTKTAAKATAHGTEVAADKTARGAKIVGKKVTGDKSPTTTPHDPQPMK